MIDPLIRAVEHPRVRGLAQLFSAVVMLTVGLGFVARGSLEAYLGRPLDPQGAVRMIVVENGTTTPELFAAFQREGLIGRSWLAQVYARSLHVARPLIPGEYRLSPGFTPLQLLERVEQGLRQEYTVVIPPGATLREVAGILASEQLVDEEAFLQAAEDPALVRELGIGSDSAEGFLFPDVWALPRRLPARAIVRRLVARFFSEAPNLRVAGARLGLTPHQLVTVASLVELGPVRAGERRLYAALLIERLQKGMALESVAADDYGRARPGAPADPRDDPWNTTARVGLPRGPIGSPSVGALRATSEPADTEPVFMVRRGGGRHVFCPDVTCYLRALSEHQPGRRAHFPLRRASEP